jgi:hypothetical protein
MNVRSMLQAELDKYQSMMTKSLIGTAKRSLANRCACKVALLVSSPTTGTLTALQVPGDRL